MTMLSTQVAAVLSLNIYHNDQIYTLSLLRVTGLLFKLWAAKRMPGWSMRLAG